MSLVIRMENTFAVSLPSGSGRSCLDPHSLHPQEKGMQNPAAGQAVMRAGGSSTQIMSPREKTGPFGVVGDPMLLFWLPCPFKL